MSFNFNWHDLSCVLSLITKCIARYDLMQILVHNLVSRISLFIQIAPYIKVDNTSIILAETYIPSTSSNLYRPKRKADLKIFEPWLSCFYTAENWVYVKTEFTYSFNEQQKKETGNVHYSKRFSIFEHNSSSSANHTFDTLARTK